LVELLYIVAIAIVAAGVGLRLLRLVGPICYSRIEELVFAVGFGLGVIALAMMALGFAHLLYVEVLYGLLALCVLFGSKELVGLAGRLGGHLSGHRFKWRSFYFWLSALIACGLLLNLLRGLLPAHGAVDPLAYHLALPKLYLLRNHLSFERTLTGALYPDNIGMLYLLAIGLRGASLAQVVHWFMGATTVVGIWCFCRMYFSGRIGVWAAGIYSFMPVFVFFSPLAYVDVGVGLFQFLGLWALTKWLREGERRALLLTAIFMGLAMGSKHTGIFMAVAVAAVVLGRGSYKRDSIKSTVQLLALYSVVALGLASPWYLRALWEAGNPVWPVANELFGGLPYKGSYSISSGAAGVAAKSFLDRAGDLAQVAAVSLWEWAWNGKLGWQRATGVYFVALLPGLLVYWRRASVRWIMAACLAYYLLAVLYIDGNPRYNFALFALMSTLAGFIAERLATQRLRLLGLAFKVAFVVTVVANLGQGYAWAYQGIRYAASAQTPDHFLLENERAYEAFRFVDKHLPEDSVILLQGIVKGYYCERIYMWDHPYQMLLQYADYATSPRLLEKFRTMGVTHIVRMIAIPPSRTEGVGYPQYFADPQHEDFRKKHLKLLHRDRGYVVFEVVYPL